MSKVIQVPKTFNISSHFSSMNISFQLDQIKIQYKFDRLVLDLGSIDIYFEGRHKLI